MGDKAKQVVETELGKHLARLHHELYEISHLHKELERKKADYEHLLETTKELSALAGYTEEERIVIDAGYANETHYIPISETEKRFNEYKSQK